MIFKNLKKILVIYLFCFSSCAFTMCFDRLVQACCCCFYTETKESANAPDNIPHQGNKTPIIRITHNSHIMSNASSNNSAPSSPIASIDAPNQTPTAKSMNANRIK